MLRRWDTLTAPEQAFVASYMCHLAVDEAWSAVSGELLQALALKTWDDLPIPAEAMLFTFNMLRQDLFTGFSTIASLLNGGDVRVPPG